MLSLANLQMLFAEALNRTSNDITKHITNSYIIYQNSITSALQKSLAEIYPVCKKLLGDDCFTHLISCYIQARPAYSPDLGEYGENFANYISTTPLVNSLIYLPDVAHLEWSWHKIYTSPSGVPFDFEQLNTISRPEQIIFLLAPGSYLLNSPYPIHLIWQANQGTSDPTPSIILNNNVHFYYFIWRKQLDLRIDIMTPIEWQILKWISDKVNLSDLYDKTQASFPEVSINTLLPYFVNSGWINGFFIDPL